LSIIQSVYCTLPFPAVIGDVDSTAFMTLLETQILHFKKNEQTSMG